MKSVMKSQAKEESRAAELMVTIEPSADLLQISLDVDPDHTEDSELPQMQGVAVASGATVPEEIEACRTFLKFQNAVDFQFKG